MNKINIDEARGVDFTGKLEKVVREIFHSRDVLQAELDALVVTSNKQLLAANRKIAALEKEIEETKAELLVVASSHTMSKYDNHNLSSVSNDIDVIVGRGTSTMGSPFYSHMFVDEAKSPIGGDRGALLRPSNSRSPMNKNGQSPRVTHTTQGHLSEVEKALELKTSELETVWDRNIELHAQVTELKAQLAMPPTTTLKTPAESAAAGADGPDEVWQFQRKEVTKRKSASIISMFKNLTPIRKAAAPNLTTATEEEVPVYNPEDIQKIVEQNAELQAEIGLLSLASDNQSNSSGRLIQELEDTLQSTGSELQSLLEENSLLKKNVQLLEDSLSAEKDSGEQKQLHVEALQAELDRTVLLIQDLDTKICSKAYELDELHDICRQYATQASEGTLSVRAITTDTDTGLFVMDGSTCISKKGSVSDAINPSLASGLGPKISSKELAKAKHRISELEKENRTMKSELEARKEKSGDFVEETEKMIKTIIQENNALQSEFETFVISSNKKLKLTERRVTELESDLKQKNKQLLAYGIKNDTSTSVTDAGLHNNLGSELDASPTSSGTTESFMRQRLAELEKLLEVKTSELGSVWDKNIELHAQITDLKAQVPKTVTKAVPDIITDTSVPHSFNDLADSKRPKSAKKRSGSIISMFKNLSPVRKASAPVLTTDEDKEEVPVYNPEDIQKIVEQNAELQAEIGLLSLASDNQSNSTGRIIQELEDALQSTGSELQSLLEENSLLKKNVQLLEDSLSAEKNSGEQKQLHVEALQAELDRTVLLIQDLDTKICSKAYELDELHDICRQYAIKANEGTLSVRAITTTTNTATDDISVSIRSVHEIEAQIRDLKKFNMVSSLPQLLEQPPAAPTAVQSAGTKISEQQVGSKSFVSDIFVQFDKSDETNGSKPPQGPYVNGLLGIATQEPAPTSITSANDNSFGDMFNFSSILGISSNKPNLAVESGPPLVDLAVLQQNHEAIVEALKQENEILMDQLNSMKAETNDIAIELGRILDILGRKLGKSKVRDQKVSLSNPEPLQSQGNLQLLRNIATLINEMPAENGTTKNGSGSGSRLSVSATAPVVTSKAVAPTTRDIAKVEQELQVAHEKCVTIEKQASQVSLQLEESKRTMNDLNKSISNYRKVLEDVYRELYIVANQIKMSTVVLTQRKTSKFLNANPSNLEEDILTQCTQLGDSVSSILEQLNEHDRMLHELREDVLSAQTDPAEQVAPVAAIETTTSNDSLMPDFNSIFSFTGLVPVSSPVAASTPTAKSAPPSSVSSPRPDLRHKILADQCKSLEQDILTLHEQKRSLERQLSETIEELNRKKDLEQQQLAVAVTTINQKKDLEQQLAEELAAKRNLEQQIAAMADELVQKKDLERQLAAATEQIQNITVNDTEQLFQSDTFTGPIKSALIAAPPLTTLSSTPDPREYSLARRCEKLESDNLVLMQQKNDLEQQLLVLTEELALQKDLERQLAAANEKIQNTAVKDTKQQHQSGTSGTQVNEPSDSIVPGLNAILSFSGLVPTDSAPLPSVTPSTGPDPLDSSLARRCEKLESDSLVLQQQKNDLEQQLLVLTEEVALKRNLEQQLAAVAEELTTLKDQKRVLSAHPLPLPTHQSKKEVSSSLGSVMFKLFREDTFSAEGITNPARTTTSDVRKKAVTKVPSQVRALKEQHAVSMQLANTTSANLWAASESSSSTSSIDQAGSKFFEEADIFSPAPDTSNSNGPLDKLKQQQVEITVGDQHRATAVSGKQLTIVVPSTPIAATQASHTPVPASSSVLGVSTQPEAQLSPATRNKKSEDLPAPANASLAFAMQQIDQLQSEIRVQETEQRKMTEQLTLYRDSSAVSMKVLEENLQQSRCDNDRLVNENKTLSDELLEWAGKYSALETSNNAQVAAIGDSKGSLVRSLEDKIAQQELALHDTRIEVRKLLQKVTTTTTTTTTTLPAG